MKLFLRYAWPVICVVLLQVLILFITVPKSPLLGMLRIYAFIVVDFVLAWGQSYEYRNGLRWKADLERLRPRVKGMCTCATVWSAYFHCDIHGVKPPVRLETPLDPHQALNRLNRFRNAAGLAIKVKVGPNKKTL